MTDSCWLPGQREAAQAWIDAHRDALPSTLSELSAFPMMVRRAIARALPATQRVAVWREHLEMVCSVSRSGSPEQRALIADIVEQLPHLVGDDLAQAEATFRPFEPRLLALLTREEAVEALATLGPPEPPGGIAFPPAEADGAPG